MSRLEKAAATTLAVSFLLLAGVLIRSYVVSRQLDPAVVPQVKIGEKVKLPGFSRGQARHTLVLVISSQCPYCIHEMPLYQKLAVLRDSSGGALRLVAVLPEKTEAAAEFMSSSGVKADSVLSLAPLELGVPMIPTLMLLDDRGTLQKYWVGDMNRQQHQEVLAEVTKACIECRVPTAGAASVLERR
jgi:hypothetical protein